MNKREMRKIRRQVIKDFMLDRDLIGSIRNAVRYTERAVFGFELKAYSDGYIFIKPEGIK